MLLFRFYASCLFPLALLTVFWFDLGLFALLPGVIFFAGVPLFDPLIGKSHKNVDFRSLSQWQVFVLDLAPVAFIFLYLLSLVAAAWYASVVDNWLVLASCTFTLGTIASIGFSASHELIHRRTRWNTFWARGGLLGVAFMHFEIEHLCSHHRYACTKQDTSTGWYRESVYAFLLRAIPKGFVFSWRFEVERLRRAGLSPWHPRNRVIWYVVLPILVMSLFYGFFGLSGLLMYAGQAVIGSVVLMIVAYIEHYGILREVDAVGKAERIGVKHSWDSYYVLSNSLVFNVQRHSDHHMKATRQYPLLKSAQSALELPAGYQAMIALALVPPLWRRVMDPRLPDEYRHLAETFDGLEPEGQTP